MQIVPVILKKGGFQCSLLLILLQLIESSSTKSAEDTILENFHLRISTLQTALTFVIALEKNALGAVCAHDGPYAVFVLVFNSGGVRNWRILELLTRASVINKQLKQVIINLLFTVRTFLQIAKVLHSEVANKS